MSYANIETSIRCTAMARPIRTGKPDTIEAVARAAGVSTMTVSRVLRGKENVAEKTRERVLRAVEAIGYVPNRLAGALATSRSSHVAVIVPTLRNIVFPEVLAGIADTLEPTGLQPVIGITEYDLTKERDLVRSMLAWRPVGFILANTTHLPETRRMLSRSSVPVVETMELTPTPIDICVGLDQHEAGAVMGGYLIAKGYRHFGYLGADHALDRAAARRFAGFAQAIDAEGGSIVATKTVREPSGVGLGRNNLGALLADAPGVDAIYCSNDAVAAGAMMHCLARGIAIPDDLALAGFGGLDLAASMPIPITTVRSPRYRMGAVSAAGILAVVEGRETDRVTDTAFELVQAESA